MSTVYIISEFGKLTKENEILVFYHKDGTIRKIFPYKTDILIIMSYVTITGQAFSLLLKNSIDTIFLSSNGRFNGKIQYNPNKNVFLRQKQYKLNEDKKRSLSIAKSIIIAKTKNQLNAIQRIKRKKNLELQIDNSIQSIKRIRTQLESIDNIDQLRGFEGSASKSYFSVFRYNINPVWADFPKRSRNPPKSNVNAVLSFLYTLLMYRVEAAIEAIGLDPMVGFLHAPDYGKNSLVFDLVEEFRIPIADALCCSLFNLGILAEKDFYSVDESEVELSSTPDEENIDDENIKKAILLNNEGLKKVINYYEKKLNSEIFYSPLNQRLSFNRIIIEQVKTIKRVINNEEAEYKGFIYK